MINGVFFLDIDVGRGTTTRGTVPLVKSLPLEGKVSAKLTDEVENGTARRILILSGV